MPDYFSTMAMKLFSAFVATIIGSVTLASGILFTFDMDIETNQIAEAINENQPFNIIHNEKVIKIDFIIAKDTEYEKIKFQRKVIKDVEGVRISIISQEDLILSKLFWAKDSHSQQQISDVKNIISFNKERLDFNYIKKWAEILSIKDILQDCI